MEDPTYTFHRSYPYDLLDEDNISWYDGSAFLDTFDYVINDCNTSMDQNCNEGYVNLSNVDVHPKTCSSQPKTRVHLNTGASLHTNDYTQESNKSDFCIGERQS